MIQAATPERSSHAPPAHRPRLGIVVGLGWGVRNYLLSDAFDVLCERFEPVILSPYGDVPEFREHFESRGAIVRPWVEADEPAVARTIFKLAEIAYYYRTPTANHLMKLRNRGNGLGK